jgi:disabled family protein 2
MSTANEDNQKKFTEGVLVKGKLFGVEDVKKETGEDVCNDAMIKLKAIIAVKKEHKKRITLKVNLEGIEILDEENKSLYKHSVNRISYIARDMKDARAIGYIYKSENDSFQYYGIRTEKQAQEFFNLLKELFEVVLEMRTGKKNSSEVEIKTESKEEEKKKEANSSVKLEAKPDNSFVDNNDKAMLISNDDNNENEEIKAAKPEPSLFDFTAEATPTVTATPAPVVDDPFGLGDLTLESAPASNNQSNFQSSNPSNEVKLEDNFFNMMNTTTNPNLTFSPPQASSFNVFNNQNTPNVNMSMQFTPNPFGQSTFAAAPLNLAPRTAPAAPTTTNNNLNLDACDSLF